MPGKRREDARIKIPALVHLTRLGYCYLPVAGVRRDPGTNILTDVFREALERVNGRPVSPEVAGLLLEEIRQALALDDLGEAFFEQLQSSWRGLRLIDFERPENNTFHVMTELPCVSGRSRFRPDVTLLLNGMPLAFVEVKDPSPGGDVRSEYDRMHRRARNPELRRFINETQIMVFSNDGTEADPLIPLRGAFYATTAYDDFLFHAPGGPETDFQPELRPRDSLQEALILRDARLEELAGTPGYEASLSPLTPTHRLLTSLFHPRRLLFFLRYGIFYLQEAETDGAPRVTKQIVRFPQLFAARLPESGSRPAPGGVWRLRAGGKAALTGVQIRILADYCARQAMTPRFFYLVRQPRRAAQVAAELRGRGFQVLEARSLEDSSSPTMREDQWVRPPKPLIRVVCVPDPAGTPIPPAASDPVPSRRIYFLDEMDAGYEAGLSFLGRLRAADPEALLIAYSWSAGAEEGSDRPESAPLLFAGKIP